MFVVRQDIMFILFPGPPRSHMDLTLPFVCGEHYSFFKNYNYHYVFKNLDLQGGVLQLILAMGISSQRVV